MSSFSSPADSAILSKQFAAVEHDKGSYSCVQSHTIHAVTCLQVLVLASATPCIPAAALPVLGVMSNAIITNGVDCLIVGLSSGGQQSIDAIFTPTAMGQAEVLVACCTDSMSSPAGFSAVSHVKGVSVAYTVQPYPPATPLPPPPTLAALSDCATTIGNAGHQSAVLIPNAMLEAQTSDSNIHQEQRPHQGGSVRADFGDCGIGQSQSLLLSIANESPIAASVRLWLGTFQADPPSAAATSAAALTQPYAVASSGSVLPRSPTGQRSHLPQLLSAGGTSAKWGQSASLPLSLGSTALAGGAQSPTPNLRFGSAAGAGEPQRPTPSLRLGSTAGPGGSNMGYKHSARRAGSRTGTEHGNKHSLVSPSSRCTRSLRLGLNPSPETQGALKSMHLRAIANG